MNSIIIKEIESKSIVWFEPSNQYLIVESITAKVIEGISKKKDIQTMASELESDLDIPFEKAIDFILDLEEKIIKPNMEIEQQTSLNKRNFSRPDQFEFTKYYLINSKVFKIEYSNEFEVSLVHPKFAHLACSTPESFHHHFQVFNQGGHIYLVIEDELIGSWSKKEIHYFQGKVSMRIIEKIYDKIEENWMGVFHASAISQNENSIFLLGDSGSGKSTSLAILQGNGLNCVADDFVPVDNQTKVHSFPAGISIKKTALDLLLPMYPELQTSAEYYYERLNKTVRYLPPNKIDFNSTYPCNALIFIKYDPIVDLELEKVTNIEAFQNLIPDSWISQKPKNVSIFLDWFSSLPCYILSYSDNQKMIDTIGNILNNES